MDRAADLATPVHAAPAGGVARRVEASPASARSGDRHPNFAPMLKAAVARRSDPKREQRQEAPADELVYRLVDVMTGYVSEQTPNDARTKLRAYIDSEIAARAEPRPTVERSA